MILLALGVGAGLLFLLLTFSVSWATRRCPVPGDVPHFVRCAGRADSGCDPRRRRDRLVRYPDLPGLLVLRVLLTAPSLENLDHNSILGLSTLGWLTFGALWIVQTISSSTGWT